MGLQRGAAYRDATRRRSQAVPRPSSKPSHVTPGSPLVEVRARASGARGACARKLSRSGHRASALEAKPLAARQRPLLEATAPPGFRLLPTTCGLPAVPMPEADVTRLLEEVEAGEAGAFDRLLAEVYPALRDMARAKLRDQRGGHTLNATGLVHEAYLRLVRYQDVEWKGRAHFFGAASQTMRRVLVDHARKKTAEKRKGEHVSLTQVGEEASARSRSTSFWRSTRRWSGWQRSARGGSVWWSAATSRGSRWTRPPRPSTSPTPPSRTTGASRERGSIASWRRDVSPARIARAPRDPEPLAPEAGDVQAPVDSPEAPDP